MGNGRCRMHGGKTPNGIASPNWKTGRWGATIRNPKLRDHFYAALSDESVRSLQRDIAILDAFVAQGLEDLPVKKSDPAGRRELLTYLEARRRAVMDLAKLERDLELWVHHVLYHRIQVEHMKLWREMMVLPDGTPDVQRLTYVHGRLSRIVAEVKAAKTVDLDADFEVDGEGGGDDSDPGK